MSNDTEARTEAVYQYIFEFFKEHHLPPSIRDIIQGEVGEATALGAITSTAVARWHIEKLIERERVAWRRVPNGPAAGQRAPRGMMLPNSRMVVLSDEDWDRLREVVLEARKRYPALRDQMERIYDELFGGRGE